MLTKAIVAHVVGDWLFQNSWMARNKGRDMRVLIIHVLITGIPFIFIGLSVAQIILIALSHLLIDGYKLGKVWNRIFKQDDYLFVQIMSDQAFHLLSIAIIVGIN